MDKVWEKRQEELMRGKKRIEEEFGEEEEVE